MTNSIGRRNAERIQKLVDEMDISEEARIAGDAIWQQGVMSKEEMIEVIQAAIDKSNAKLREKIEFTPPNPAAEAIRDRIAHWPKENLEAIHGRE